MRYLRSLRLIHFVPLHHSKETLEDLQVSVKIFVCLFFSGVSVRILDEPGYRFVIFFRGPAFESGRKIIGLTKFSFGVSIVLLFVGF